MQLAPTRSVRTLPRLSRSAPHYALLRAALRAGVYLSTGMAIGAAYGFDSGLMLDYIYRNQPNGTNALGRLLDRYFLNQPGWNACRARKTLLQRHLREMILARREQQQPTNLLDVAAGPGRYILELLCQLGGEDIRLTCRDQNRHALTVGQRQAAQLWLADRVTYAWGDATLPADLARVSPPPDIVVVSGLYENLTDDAAVCQSLLGIRTILAPGGVLLFTNHVAHPQLEFIANVLTNGRGQPWVMGTRPLARVERWAREAGFSNMRSELEPHGIFSITRCETGNGKRET